ncbi:MAG: DNA repair exonuclease [Candidatus Hydrogenedentota bacterium]
MKIIHTSDVHLDRCFVGSSQSVHFGNRRRQSLRDVFQTIISRAREWPADILLIAGDLFEYDRVTSDTIAFIRNEFKSIPNTLIFIAPGNHDPYIPDSPYATESWPENVHVFKKSTWESASVHGGAAYVHGFGYNSPYFTENPFGQLAIPEKQRDAIHLAVAHGSETAHRPADKEEYAPFSVQQAVTPSLHYLALGHYHAGRELKGDFDTRVFYSGSPEGVSFQEIGMHHFVEIEIQSGDAPVVVNPVPVSRVIYIDEELPCDTFKTSEEVTGAIRTIAQGYEVQVIGRFTLTGVCEPDIQSEIGLIHDSASLDFEYLEVIDGTNPCEDYAELAREDTSLGLYSRVLNAKIDAAGDGARREMLERARELGIAAFRDRNVEIKGLERG